MNSAHGVAGGRGRRSSGEGAKRQGNDEPDAMARSDFGKTHRESEQRDEHGLALMAAGHTMRSIQLCTVYACMCAVRGIPCCSVDALG